MIRLDHVVKHYRRDRGVRFAVTNDISLTFPAKGLVIILGASGSGKTTLLNLLCGLDRFDTGSLTFDDQVFTTYDPAAGTGSGGRRSATSTRASIS